MPDSSRSRGPFVWHELRTTDPVAAADFYGGLLGWTTADRPVGLAFRAADRVVAGLSEVATDVPPHWSTYVSVADADRTAAIAAAAGGTIVTPPTQSPHPPGLMSVVIHPRAGGVILFEGSADSSVVPAFSWHQLNTPDPAGSVRFYGTLFGWSAAALPGCSTTFADVDGREIASLTTVPPDVPAHWLPYARVESVGDITRRAGELGAKVLMEAADGPKVRRLSVLQDPQGAAVAFFEPHSGA